MAIMLFADTLVVIGLATASLGTIHEADGVIEKKFQFCNAGTSDVKLVEGYTSCGCTTMEFPVDALLHAGDTATVTLAFNPRGKSGEFMQEGTIVYETPSGTKDITFVLTGTCITSQETLLRQFPIRINDRLRISADRFDLGTVRVGETKERGVVVLHADEDNRQEYIAVSVTPGDKTTKGLQHLMKTITTHDGQGQLHHISITFDMMVK